MRTRTILAGIEIPCIVILVHSTAFKLIKKLLMTFLTHRSADNFTYTGEQHIGALHGTSVRILLHIKGFYLRRIIGHDNRSLKMLLHKIAFMFRGKVHSPSRYREFELVSSLNSLFQNMNSLGVRETDKALIND